MSRIVSHVRRFYDGRFRPQLTKDTAQRFPDQDMIVGDKDLHAGGPVRGTRLEGTSLLGRGHYAA